ncbi:hypothetical protein HS7_09040 [Sulfolobales archaeon HS-7]|nr:hypothetical protein HS7_09040 [Sulfolobales archaeon HS-7]
MDKKTIVVIVLIPLILYVYSLITHVSLINALESVKPEEYAYFIGAYMLQCYVLSIRDSYIVKRISKIKISRLYAFRARVASNFIGFIIPGTVGGDLTRALYYQRKGAKVHESFASSLIEAFFDGIAGNGLYIFLFLVFLNVGTVIFFLIALANLIFWIALVGYFHLSSRINRVEAFLLSKLPINIDLNRFYSEFKGDFKKISVYKEMVLIGIILTTIGYLIVAIPFIIYTNHYLTALLANQLYQVASFIPIPGYAGITELALSSVLPPKNVIEVRYLEIINALTGIYGVKDIDINDLRNAINEIRVGN